MELTAEDRNGLIKQLNRVAVNLNEAVDGPARGELKAELRRLVRLLWLDGEPEPS